MAALQAMLDELVQAIEVDIGEELAVQVADGQAFVGVRLEQRLMRRHLIQHRRVALDDIIPGAVVIHQHPRQPQRIVVVDFRREQGKQHVLVDGHEVIVDVELQIPSGPGAVAGRLANELPQPIHPRVYALAPATSIGIVDEDRLPNPLQVIHQHMVDHPVAEIRREDFPQLRAFDKKADGTGGGVAAPRQRRLQVQQVFLLPDFKAQGVEGVAFVAPAG